jgi:hypothetical protein
VALDVTRGETLSSIAKRYGFSLMAVSRHRTNCLGVDEGEARQVAKAVNRRIIEAALPTRENLVGRLEDVSRRIDQLASEAEGMGPSAISLGALAELRRTVESLAKVAGITDRAADVKLACRSTPPARQAISRASLAGAPQRQPRRAGGTRRCPHGRERAGRGAMTPAELRRTATCSTRLAGPRTY